jgi:hypothetical protein
MLSRAVLCAALLLIAVPLSDAVHAPTDLVVGLKHSTAALEALDRTVAEVSTHPSPTYGQYLSPEQLDEMLRPSPRALASVRGWLERDVGCALVLGGPRFKHTLRCRLDASYVATRPPTPPLAVRDLVDFVVLQAPRRVRRVEKEVEGEVGEEVSGGGHYAPYDLTPASPRSSHSSLSSGVTPAQARAQYGLPESTRGGGLNSSNSQMVWGPGTFGFLRSDLSSFYTQYCPDCKYNKVGGGGSGGGGGGGGDGTDLLTYDVPANEGTPGGDNFDEGGRYTIGVILRT